MWMVTAVDKEIKACTYGTLSLDTGQIEPDRGGAPEKTLSPPIYRPVTCGRYGKFRFLGVSLKPRSQPIENFERTALLPSKTGAQRKCSSLGASFGMRSRRATCTAERKSLHLAALFHSGSRKSSRDAQANLLCLRGTTCLRFTPPDHVNANSLVPQPGLLV